MPRTYWKSRNSADNRLLIDCIDHELYHIADYASGLANRYYTAYGGSAYSNNINEKAYQTMKNIMDYRAYSGNQYYNERFRPNNPVRDYSETIETLRKQLPRGWWNIR